MLLRTTKFRILGSIGVCIPVLLGIVFALIEANGVELPIGMDAYMPFWMYSFLQTVVIAFIVGDFRAADEQAHIYEVVAGRPVSTAELVAGKYLGIVSALVLLSLGVLILTLGIQAAKISITGNPFNVEPYIGYLVLMNLPALIFMSSLTFFLGALLRRQAAVALIAIGYLLARDDVFGQAIRRHLRLRRFFSALVLLRLDRPGRRDASGIATPVLRFARHWLFWFFN